MRQQAPAPTPTTSPRPATRQVSSPQPNSRKIEANAEEGTEPETARVMGAVSVACGYGFYMNQRNSPKHNHRQPSPRLLRHRPRRDRGGAEAREPGPAQIGRLRPPEVGARPSLKVMPP